MQIQTSVETPTAVYLSQAGTISHDTLLTITQEQQFTRVHMEKETQRFKANAAH